MYLHMKECMSSGGDCYLGLPLGQPTSVSYFVIILISCNFQSANSNMQCIPVGSDQDVFPIEFIIISHWSQSMFTGFIHCCGSICQTRLGKPALSEDDAWPLLRSTGWLMVFIWLFDLVLCNGVLCSSSSTRPDAVIHLLDLESCPSVKKTHVIRSRKLTTSGRESLLSGCTADFAPLNPRAENGTHAAAAPHSVHRVLGAP